MNLATIGGSIDSTGLSARHPAPRVDGITELRCRAKGNSVIAAQRCADWTGCPSPCELRQIAIDAVAYARSPEGETKWSRPSPKLCTCGKPVRKPIHDVCAACRERRPPIVCGHCKRKFKPWKTETLGCSTACNSKILAHPRTR